MTTVYLKGDLAEYTGEVLPLHGGIFYEVVMLEGHLKGEFRVTTVAPKVEAPGVMVFSSRREVAP
jgi:hypothetical protein